LRDNERERGKIKLRYIKKRRVNKMIKRIEYIMERVN
jgi:predicted transcriptional regulator